MPRRWTWARLFSDRTVSKVMQMLYRDHVTSFRAWAKKNSMEIESEESLDNTVALYLNHRFFKGDPPSRSEFAGWSDVRGSQAQLWRPGEVSLRPSQLFGGTLLVGRW